MINVRNLLLTFTAIISFLSSFADGTPLILDDETVETWIGYPYLEIFEDTSASLSIETINSPLYSQQFRPLTAKEDPVIHNFDSDYWVRFKLTNSTNQPSKWLLEFFDLNTNFISFYEENPQTHTWQELQAGNMRAFCKRQLKHKNFEFFLHINEGSSKTYYVKFHSENENMLKPVVRSYSKFINYALSEYYILGIFYGMLLLIMIFYFLFFLAIRSKAYLVHIMYVGCATLYSLSNDGMGFQYFWSGFPQINHYAHSISLWALETTALLFCMGFLNMKRLTPALYKVFLGIIVLYAIRIVGEVLFHGFPIREGWFDAFPLLVAFLAGGYFYFKLNYQPAKYFFVAYCALFLGFMITVLEQNDIIASNNFTFYALNFAVMTEVILLSFALAHKVRMTIKEKEIAQEQLVNELQLNEELKDVHNRELENRVHERTKELGKQKNLVEEKNRNITASISYAKHIQNAILPSISDVRQQFSDLFLIYWPKDIVSGDFYYFAQHKEKVILGIIDCTGHGVPGGFMSMIGYSLLNQSIYTHDVTNPGRILDLLNEGVINGLRQSREGGLKDGMDISLITIDKKTHTLQFAGAHNSLFIFRDSELIILRADRQPIGDGTTVHKHFSCQEFQLEDNDCIYAFSDGFIDQFGGPHGKKFMKRNFKELLKGICHLSMQEQQAILTKEFKTWKGEEPIVDDVTVLGLRYEYQPVNISQNDNESIVSLANH